MEIVSMKRNVTAWEWKQESWMNHIYQERSSKTIWEGKHKIRSNQMKAIAMEDNPYASFPNRLVLSVTNLNLRIWHEMCSILMIPI